MKKKGFTLIELLAVIVILAIIALIATPIILNVIEDAKKSAAEDSAYGYIEAIEFNNAMVSVNNKYTMITETDVTKINKLVNVKGIKPTSGTVKIENGRVTEALICISGYNVKYDGTKATADGSKCGNGSSNDGEKITYTVYADGTPIYYNPVSGSECEEKDLPASASIIGTNSGCMKFYAFNDNGETSSTVNMILDHNTIPTIPWNSESTNTEMKEVKNALESNTSHWKDKATVRLITADEIAEITGANSDSAIKWLSSKTYGASDIEKQSSWFYLDGSGTTYSDTDGWQKQVAQSQGSSKYAWLYDNTTGCKMNGCDVEETRVSVNGYWTSTPVSGDTDSSWFVYMQGKLDSIDVASANNDIGVRPVITISKDLLN